MASIIRVKRSTGTSAPATLNYGEVGLRLALEHMVIGVEEYLLEIIPKIHN